MSYHLTYPYPFIYPPSVHNMFSGTLLFLDI